MESGAEPATKQRMELWRHGPICFDPAALRLTVDGAETALEPRALHLFRVLLDRSGAAVSKGDIMDALWPDRIVTEASLTKCVARLRTALGDTRHTIIRTVHGFGYRLDAQSAPADSVPAEAVPIPEPALPLPALPLPEARPQAVPPVPGFRTGRTRGAAVAACFGLAATMLGFALYASSGTAAHRRPNPDAARLYLQGLQDWSARTPVSLEAARTAFARAVAIDGAYAPAHAAFARTYLLLREFGAMPEGLAYRNAKAEAKRALALDPDLATAQAALGFIQFWADWDFAAGLAAFRRAIALEPGNASTHHWYATALSVAGQTETALAEIDRALELEPGSAAIRADRGEVLAEAGRYVEARAVLAPLERADPDFAAPHRYLAGVALATGDEAGFIRESLRAADLRGDRTEAAIMTEAAAAFASGGHAGFTRALVAARRRQYEIGHGSAASLAAAYALAGQRQAALDYFEIAVRRHEAAALGEKNDVALQPLIGGGLAPITDRFQLARDAS